MPPRTTVASGGSPSLGNLLQARCPPAGGLTEPECWALLYQAVQALQDLFLSDGASGGTCMPLVTPASLLLSARGRVRFQTVGVATATSAHLTGYLAPEYRPGKHQQQVSDTDAEKMWIYGLGETLKRATLTSHAAAARFSVDLCDVLADMTRPQAPARASLMHLLDAITEYCKRREQSRPFSHICMDLHQEAMAALELALDTPWGPPAMPELRTLTRNSEPQQHSIPRRWMNLRSPQRLATREASTSMEDLAGGGNSTSLVTKLPRPKSMCIPDSVPLEKFDILFADTQSELNISPAPAPPPSTGVARFSRLKARRCNPVHRAASRLYRATAEEHNDGLIRPVVQQRECVGPEFVVRASLPARQLTMPDIKGSVRKTVTVILLSGQKLDVICNPQTTTAGQLFEMVIQKEHIEENFMLGLSALIAGDFVFLPSDTRICKASTSTTTSSSSSSFSSSSLCSSSGLTLFMRVRFFLPSLRGIRGAQAKHLMYLQLRRSIVEHQLPCAFAQLVDLDGLALQAEFGDYNEREHGQRDYFLLEHYAPETMVSCADRTALARELVRSHKFKMGLDVAKAEEDFVVLAQALPHYGGHFYTATWVLKDNTQKDVWLYISAQGISLYERAATRGPTLFEQFEWRAIQTLCYSKHYLCVLPHAHHGSKLKKYKLKMDHKKSYFTFRLASLHHQFFLRLRTEFASLTTLSAQFGIPLKDMKNETNSLYKLEALTNQYRGGGGSSVDSEPEFRVDFRPSSAASNDNGILGWRQRSRSVADFDGQLEAYQNKENEQPSRQGLVLDKRRGVKMGTRAFSASILPGRRGVSRSAENVLQSISPKPETAYVLDCSLSKTNESQQFNMHESLSESLQEKLNAISFVDERVLRAVHVRKDARGSLGVQIAAGADGKVYVQAVIAGGAAQRAGGIHAGDQIVAVDGKSLLSLSYDDALAVLKATNASVEFILSSITKPPFVSGCRVDLSDINESHLKSNRLERTMNKLKRISLQHAPEMAEKHLTESCYDIANLHKYGNGAVVPYHKHIRYEIEGGAAAAAGSPLRASRSCMEINNRAVVVDAIPKCVAPAPALPRSLGLSRKWRGPVKYPVTPIKKTGSAAGGDDNNELTSLSNFSNSDEEQRVQVFPSKMGEGKKEPVAKKECEWCKKVTLQPHHKVFLRNWRVPIVCYSLTALLGTVYCCEWKEVLQYLPYYNLKWKDEWETKDD